MVLYLLFAFLAGGFCGMVGMSVLAYGSKANLIRDNRIYRERLQFLENEKPNKYQPVEDPRVRVHALVN
jgi:hypothetical protein